MIKQLIVIRRDLGMRRGKEIAQGAHAAMAFLTKKIDATGKIVSQISKEELAWITGSFTKVVVQVPGWYELIDVLDLARSHNLEANLIIDSGATEFNGAPTATALAIGPADSEILDPLFGNLKLY